MAGAGRLHLQAKGRRRFEPGEVGFAFVDGPCQALLLRSHGRELLPRLEGLAPEHGISNRINLGGRGQLPDSGGCFDEPDRWQRREFRGIRGDIFEHRPDNLGMASEKLRNLLEENGPKLGIKLASCTRYYLRFIPTEWDQPGNTHGAAWSGSNRTVVFELNLSAKRAYLVVVVGKAPDVWIEPLWLSAASKPYRLPRKRATRPRHWCTLYYSEPFSAGELDSETISDSSELAERLYQWVVKSFQDPASRAVIKAIAEELPKLDACYPHDRPV